MDNEKNKSSDSIDILKPKYAMVRKEGWDLMVKSSISYDQALITLTTAFLGFIFAIVRLSPSTLHCVQFLVFILVSLLASIFCSLLSFWFDQLYGDSIMVYAHRFYNEGKDEYKNKKHWSYYLSMTSKIIAGALFLLSLVLFSIFLFSSHEDKASSVKKSQSISSYQNQNTTIE